MNSGDFDNVADSTDWLTTPLSGLAAVEAALRCQICKDFYKTPMLTSCNHTFCSLCIRRALSAEGKCPLCRAPEQEVKLRSNWSMEEVVTAFTQTRGAVLEFARKPPPSPPIPDSSTPSSSPKRKLKDLEDDSQERANKKTRSTRKSKTKGMEATAKIAREESNHTPPDVPDPESMDYEPDDGLVACPICTRRMKAVQVDKHIDTTCPGSPQPPQPKIEPLPISCVKASRYIQRPPPNAFPSFPSVLKTPKIKIARATPERLPTLNYSILKEAHLRKELADLSLSTSGNRAMLERRHREWVMMWNANCDSQRPRDRAALLHDLDVWERTLGSRAPTGSRAANTGAQIRDKGFDGSAWASKHDNSFKDLIASARRTRAQAQAKAQTKPEEEKKEDEEKKEGEKEGVAKTGDDVSESSSGKEKGKGKKREVISEQALEAGIQQQEIDDRMETDNR